ncbi:MAG: hypothetical protein EA360_09310 [Balneolaceae bacterium]|nr:MAG: hypothetical protein EA360_09310 [Balneolaceae bacterium]
MQNNSDNYSVNRDHSPSVNGVGISSQNQHPAGRRCLYCGQYAPMIWVHGHGQCASCGINVDECCRGESCSFG